MRMGHSESAGQGPCFSLSSSEMGFQLIPPKSEMWNTFSFQFNFQMNSMSFIVYHSVNFNFHVIQMSFQFLLLPRS